LFDFLEEKLDLPAVAVNIGGSFGTQVAVAGQKFARLAAFRIAAAGMSRAQNRFAAGDLGNKVGGDTCFSVHWAVLQKFAHGVALEAGHEENALCAEGAEPGVADETLVKYHRMKLSGAI